MNVTVLLEELHSKSVEFTLNDGHVMVDAPDEVLTPEIESLLRQYREEIFRELQAMSDNDAGKEEDNPNQPPINPVEENTQRDSETNPSLAGALLAQAGITVRYITDSAQAAIAVAELLEVGTTLGLDIETSKLAGYEQYPQAGLEPHLSRIRLVQLYAGGNEV